MLIEETYLEILLMGNNSMGYNLNSYLLESLSNEFIKCNVHQISLLVLLQVQGLEHY